MNAKVVHINKTVMVIASLELIFMLILDRFKHNIRFSFLLVVQVLVFTLNILL